jgi:hypothetical protein
MYTVDNAMVSRFTPEDQMKNARQGAKSGRKIRLLYISSETSTMEEDSGYSVEGILIPAHSGCQNVDRHRSVRSH